MHIVSAMVVVFTVAGSLETRYTCCSGDLSSDGCQVAKVRKTMIVKLLFNSLPASCEFEDC